VRERDRCLENLIGRCNPVDQTEGSRIGHRQWIASRDELERDISRQRAWQAMHAAAARKKTPLDLRKAELSVVRRHDHIACQHEFASPRQRRSAHRRDPRLDARRIDKAGEAIIRRGKEMASPFRDFLEIGTRLKDLGLLLINNRDSELGILLDALYRSVHSLCDRRIDRIPLLGPIKGHHGNVTVDNFEHYRLICLIAHDLLSFLPRSIRDRS
jgi:hypothetical protein